MKYKYNYSYLEKWIRANGDITDREILRAIGSSSNQSLGLWKGKKIPMPVIAMLRFCNTFGVPISAFIVDEDKLDDNEVIMSDSDQTTPEDGYIAGNAKRETGCRNLRDPLDVENIPSVVPGLKANVTRAAGQDGTHTYAINEGMPISGINDKRVSTEEKKNQGAAGDSNKNTNTTAVLDTTLINKLLDTIAEQQKTISDQHHQIVALTQQVISQLSQHTSFAADPIPPNDSDNK